MKSWEGQIDTKAVGFIEDTEEEENNEICPFMSYQGVFAKDETGKWIVMRPDFKGRHQCKIIKEDK